MQPPDDYRADDQFSGSRAAHPVIQPVSVRLLEQQRISPTTSPVPSATAAAEAPGTLPATAVQSTGYPAFHPNPAVRDEALFMTSPEQFAQAAAFAQYQQSIASGFSIILIKYLRNSDKISSNSEQNSMKFYRKWVNFANICRKMRRSLTKFC